MATITFTPAGDNNDEAPKVEAVETAVVIREEKPLASPAVKAAGIEGEVTASDIKPPRLNLAQKTGKLGDDFTPGVFVYDKAFAITAAPGKTFNATVLRFRKYYQQKLPFGDSQETPLKFDTAAEVRAAGGQTSQYDAPNYYPETADILFAIEAPEGLDEEHMAFFPYEIGGKHYGLAIYTVTSSGFTSIGKRIITDSTLLLRDGLWTGQYRITSEKRTSAQNSWFVPVASFDKKHAPDVAELFRNIAGF